MRKALCAFWLTLLAATAMAPAANAAFPGRSGKIAFHSVGVNGNLDIYVVDADGTGLDNLTSSPISETSPAWSPDGTRLAFNSAAGIEAMNPDGSGRHVLFSTSDGVPQWSPDATAFVVQSPLGCGPDGCFNDLFSVNADGTDRVQLTSGFGSSYRDARWSPDGSDIVFRRTIQPPGELDGIWLVDADGSNIRRFSGGGSPEWLPDAQRLARTTCCGSSSRIETVRRDGSDPVQLTFANNAPGTGRDQLAWSPDGTKLTYVLSLCSPTFTNCTYHVAVSNADGSGEQIVADGTGPGLNPDWQPILINAYARPKGATPIQVSLVPAYSACTAPNRTHGPPLAFPACNPPAQTSGELTVGTADSNARPAKSRGLVRFDALPGTPSTPADEADVRITLELLDVYEHGSLADYAGELRARTTLRITDKLNTPHPGGPGAATVSDTTLEATAQCTPTADTTEGASCSLVTTADAVVPGAVPEGRRAVWQLGQVEVLDAAGDVFLRQGLFVP